MNIKSVEVSFTNTESAEKEVEVDRGKESHGLEDARMSFVYEVLVFYIFVFVILVKIKKIVG